MNVIEIGIAEMAVAKPPDKLLIKSLGSCVGIVLYDPANKIGAMAHVMLPDSKFGSGKTNNSFNPVKYADTAIEAMVRKMIKRGAKRDSIVAKIAGGANMFTSACKNSVMSVGERNVIAVRNTLHDTKIRIVASDVGKNYGRTIELNVESGDLIIESIKMGKRRI